MSRLSLSKPHSALTLEGWSKPEPQSHKWEWASWDRLGVWLEPSAGRNSAQENGGLAHYELLASERVNVRQEI